jgi:N-acetylmuramic acid 6-phosphate etherase
MSTARHAAISLEDRLAEIEALIAQHQAEVFNDPTEGLLTTERYHGKTTGLSQLAEAHLSEALYCLKQVDLDMLSALMLYLEPMQKLSAVMRDTLRAGNKVFLSGCGAAGRAGMLAAKLLADAYPQYQSQVIAIMAGGEGALVRAAEGFEDNAEFGVRQLREALWESQDLLVCLSASGSANFLYGQLELTASAARDAAGQKPYFHLCNPLSEVSRLFADKAVFKDDSLRAQVNFLATDVGPMALAGSTRMQAATVQVLVMAGALLDACQAESSLLGLLVTLRRQLQAIDMAVLAPWIEQESLAYNKKEGVYYFASAALGMTVLTDTTERAPTFSLPYFENDLDDNTAILVSLCRLIITDAASNQAAWAAILNHVPKALSWEGMVVVSDERLLGNDLTAGIIDKRKAYLAVPHHRLALNLDNHGIHLQYDDLAPIVISLEILADLPPTWKPLAEQLTLKMLLNMASTLVAGRLKLYQSNLMTHVRASNKKLINRGIRLCYELLLQESQMPSAAPQLIAFMADKARALEVIRQQFYKEMREMHSTLPVVERTKVAVLHTIMTEASLAAVAFAGTSGRMPTDIQSDAGIKPD